jgi:hypothetical protein
VLQAIFEKMKKKYSNEIYDDNQIKKVYKNQKKIEPRDLVNK